MTAEVFANGAVWICAAIATVCVAVGWLTKIGKALNKPNATQNERISNLEQRVAKHDELFAKDLARLTEIEEGSRVTMQALLAILNHSISGNDIKSLEAAKEAITKYLISK